MKLDPNTRRTDDAARVDRGTTPCPGAIPGITGVDGDPYAITATAHYRAVSAALGAEHTDALLEGRDLADALYLAESCDRTDTAVVEGHGVRIPGRLVGMVPIGFRGGGA